MANIDKAADVPGWLTQESLGARRSVAFSIGFVLFTLVGAMLAEWLIRLIPAHFNFAFGHSSLQLQAGISLFFAWDLAAILSMILYFAFYWRRMFSKDGPMKSGGSDVVSVGHAVTFFLLGLACLVVALLAGLAFAISVPHSMPAQLILLTIAAYLIWLADRQIMTKHSDKKIQLEFKLFVEFVDIPMAICFTVLTIFYFAYVDQQNIQQFSAFMSGAIAFQIIAFNVAFSFLDRFTEVISRGKGAVLLKNDGLFARDYPEFKNSWWVHWGKGTELRGATIGDKIEELTLPKSTD